MTKEKHFNTGNQYAKKETVKAKVLTVRLSDEQSNKLEMICNTNNYKNKSTAINAMIDKFDKPQAQELEAPKQESKFYEGLAFKKYVEMNNLKIEDDDYRFMPLFTMIAQQMNTRLFEEDGYKIVLFLTDMSSVVFDSRTHSYRFTEPAFRLEDIK